MSESQRVNRRGFAQQLAMGAGVTIGATAVPTAAVEPPAAVPPAPKLPTDSMEGPLPPPPEVLLLSYLVQRYPSQNFDEATLAGIFRDLRGDVARGELLAQFPLTNADEPAFVFTPYRNDPDMPSEQE